MIEYLQKEDRFIMNKCKISAILAGFVAMAHSVAMAAYPVYPTRQTANNGVVIPAGVQLPSANSRIVGTSGMPTMQSVTAAQPTRVTGALPRVGSAATTAGRQYYQASDYDRLADSGLYVGLSAAYAASVMGNMSADYANEQNAFFVPGAFQDASFKKDSVIPLQLSVGASINNDFRVDFSYLRYTNLSYPSNVETSNGAGGFISAKVDGGAITSNATMLNLYYNIDSFTGYLAGGALRPYVGVGVGMALNTIADYVVYDPTFYSEMDPAVAGAGDLTAISDVTAYHNGGTTEQFAFMLEGGVTTDMNGGVKLDFFVRYANLGQVKTSGSIIVSQVEWLGDGAGGEYQAPYDSVFHYTNWYESGRIGIVDLGVRLRLQF